MGGVAVSDAVAFISAQLDHDEQVAPGASPGPWVVLPREEWETEDGYVVEASPNATGYRHKVAAPGYNGGGVWEAADATHIALHDPDRVLLQVAAYRRILARFAAGREFAEQTYSAIPALGFYRHLFADLASIYSDRPGFDPAWTVE